MKKITKGAVVRWVAKAGASLGALLLASSAAADSPVTYPGYSCWFAEPGGSQSGFTDGEADFYGGYTICPLVRINSADTTDISTIIVRVQDNSTTQSVGCYAVSCDGTASACDETDPQYSGGGDDSFTGTTYMNMGSLTAYSNGFAYIQCDFPNDSSKSVLYSYRATD